MSLYSERSPAQELTPDMNVPSFPVPKEYSEDLPGFLQVLISQYDEVKDELSRIWADKYKSPSPIGTVHEKSDVRKRMERDRHEEELEEKEQALLAQIRELRALIPPKPPADLSSKK